MSSEIATVCEPVASLKKLEHKRNLSIAMPKQLQSSLS